MLSTLNPEVGDRQIESRFLVLLSDCFLRLTRRASPVDWMVRIAAVILPTLLLGAVILQPWVEPKWMFLDPLTAAQLSGDAVTVSMGLYPP